MLINFFLIFIISESTNDAPEELKSLPLINWQNDDKGRRKVRISIPHSDEEVRCNVINGDELVGIGTGSVQHPAIGKIDKLNIPSKFKFLRKQFYVVSIRKYAFYRSEIGEITFPPEIETIEPYAFFGATIFSTLDLSKTKVTKIPNFTFCDANIKKIKIPPSVTFIGEQAFSLSHIEEFVFPDCINEMLPAVFRMCDCLTFVDMSRSKMKTIAERTFERCTALETIILPPVLDNIGEGCFFSCTSLESIDLSKYPLKSICDFAFYNCFNLKQIGFPKNLQNLGRACLGSTRLDDLEFPRTLQTIGDNIFKFCIELHDINLVDTSLTVIPKAAFAKCPSLQSIMLPNTITSIEEEAFYMCLALVSIDLSATSVQVIGKSAFQSCPVFKTIKFSPTITKIEAMAFAQSAISEFIAPPTIVSIGQECFFRSISLNVADLSKTSVTVLDQLTFYDCRSLSKLILPPALQKLGQACVSWCAFTELVIPSSVTSIGHMVFANCYYIKEIDLSATGISELPYGAFSNCIRITRIIFPSAMKGFSEIPAHVEIFTENEIITPKNWQEEKDSITKNLVPPTFMGQVTLEEHSSFYNCKELLSIDLSTTELKIIPDWSFLNCSSLIHVHMPATIETIGEGAFRGTQITDVILPKNVREVGQYAYAFNTKLIRADFSKASITSLQEGTFYGCSSLSNFNFPQSVESIGMVCFNGTAFSEMFLPQTITELGKYAFSENSQLVSIDLSETTIQKIREGAFSKCSRLVTIVFPKSLRAIGSAAFAGCLMQEMKFPSTLTSINNAAFAYCTRLKFAILEETSLKVLRANAFEGCSSLSRVAFPTSLIEIGDYVFLHCPLLGEITYLGSSELNSKQALPKDVKFVLSPSYSSIKFLGYEITPDKKNGVFKIKTRPLF